MFPSSQQLTGKEHPPQGTLEDRLRGLILSNVDQIPASGTSVAAQPPTILPPHMMVATPEEQQTYLARAAARPVAQNPPIPLEQQQQLTGRKKPNQAQRRQMNSQLSIPIDPRPNQTQQPARGYGGNSSQPSWTPQHFNGYNQPQHNQRYQQQPSRFQQTSSPYSPRGNYSQGPQSSPGHQLQSGNHYQTRQGQPQLQGQFSPGTSGFTGAPYARPLPQNRQLFQPGPQNGQGRGRPFGHNSEDISYQCAHLERLLQECIPNVQIEPEEEAAKESFRAVIEKACRDSIGEYEQQELGNSKFVVSTVELKCFGSMSSGFATKASDMDLALLTPHSYPAADSPESPIPRLLEKKLLDAGYGARLLTRTRVPIIKLCEKPTEKLRADLLEERAKWENGFVAEGEDGQEESNELESHSDIKDDKLPSLAPEAAEVAAQKTATSSHGDPKSLLRQKENQSLGDYYNNAKRHLRKLGGFDLSASAPELSPEQSKILNNVCKSFISGLASESLSTQLRTYKSISPLFDEPEEFTQRSLNGVWTQIEGERLAMGFKNRPLIEANERHESECLEAVESWRALQDKSEWFTEPLLFNRHLYIASEKLKKFSSLQLVFLEQIQHEDPIQYSSRAKRIMDDLKGFQHGGSDMVTPIIIAHYVSGISNRQIRDEMQKLMSLELNFPQIAIKHRILQLAVDYEHAMSKDIYDDTHRTYVERYIAFLRANATASTAPHIESDLLAKIRTLPDPTLTSPNKPRDRYRDHLEFPKTDIGIQCDINFSAHLALHNTLLLRCYSHSDPRVRLLILFVKHWAKARGINTPYRGTLSSYGYVLMVLHYLVNIASPFVCPNLQLLHREPPPYLPPAEIEARTTCHGRDVRFWRNEAEIKDISFRGLLNHNHDSMGMLLRGFFEYFAQNGQMSTVQNRGFDWGREVLSLRTPGGILTKQEKGWVGAKTVYETTTIAAPPASSTPAMKVANPKDLTIKVDTVAAEGEASEVKAPKLQMKTVEETKEIRHRYLFAIEDPFELDHNVARTVTHNGIVSIRDEFRRAWRIIRNIGKGRENEDLLALALNDNDMKGGLQGVLDQIHGTQ